MDVVELSRRLANLIRLGTVHSVDHGAARCRVQTGALTSDWLPWLTARAGDTRTWCPPTIGEQVVVFCPSGEPENGVVLPGLYCDDHAAPSSSPDLHVIDYPDGARITYDHATGALEATGIQTARINAAVSITLDTPLVHITEQCVVDGLLTYNAGLAGTGGSHGTVITGNIEHEHGDFTHSDGSLSSNGIVLDTHHHTGVQSGGSNTGGPA